MTPEPLKFVIPIDVFDAMLLPEGERDPGTDSFRQAVRTYYQQEFAPLGGSVQIDIDGQRIEVTWEPEEAYAEGLFEHALRLLRDGRLVDAVPLLQALTAVEPENIDAHYNLGMALSDLGALEDAKLQLLRVTHLAPGHVNALVALGVALSRSGDPAAAKRRLQQAVERAPNNGYAQRNLGAVLGNLGETQAAGQHLREAYRLLPADQQSVYGYARWFIDFGGEDEWAEADRLLKEAIELDPDTQLAELARQARSDIAQQRFRGATVSPRMDAVMYCLGALEKFAALSASEVQQVAFEIAMLGQRGLDANDPDVTYTLRTLPGSYTGLHLVCLMYVGFKQAAPEMEVGFDLATEYEAAQQLHTARQGGS